MGGTDRRSRVCGRETPKLRLNIRFLYNFSYLSSCFSLSSFPSSTLCTGITHSSEDSSELAFLLVENYTLTTPAGLRVGREFLEFKKGN